MAIVTHLMARSFGKPMVLLPSVVVARHQYAHAVACATLKPKKEKAMKADVYERRVGVSALCSEYRYR